MIATDAHQGLREAIRKEVQKNYAELLDALYDETGADHEPADERPRLRELDPLKERPTEACSTETQRSHQQAQTPRNAACT